MNAERQVIPGGSRKYATSAAGGGSEAGMKPDGGESPDEPEPTDDIPPPMGWLR